MRAVIDEHKSYRVTLSELTGVSLLGYEHFRWITSRWCHEG